MPTNELLRAQLATEDVGPFRATMFWGALDSLRQVLADIEVEEPDLHAQMVSFGALCVRLVRGSETVLGNHSFGTAIDVGSRMHGLAAIGRSGGPADRATEYAERIAPFFERAGWRWGGRKTHSEPAHFELSRELFERLVDEGRIRVWEPSN